LARSDAGISLNVPVDVCPDRFRLILDWYRYGEIWVPATLATEAVLKDAARLELPEEIVVNGTLRSTRAVSAKQVGRTLIAGVVNRWPGFRAFFTQTLNQIDQHFLSAASSSSTSVAANDDEAAAAEEAFDFPRFVLPLFREGWVTPTQVCSAARARVLALKLEELGYLCEFSDSELLVSLPLKLRCELMPSSGPDAAEAEASQPEEANHGS